MGQRPQAYVAKSSGGAWARLGGSLNMDPAGGSVERVSLAVYAGQPVAAWGEVSQGYMRQIYVKQWNGSSWAALNGPPPGPISACDLNTDGIVDIADVQGAINQALGNPPCGSADLQPIGHCTVVGIQRVINASFGGACLTGH